MAIEFTARINPIGTTAERRSESLVSQLKLQNEQLQAIIRDLYREIDELKKGKG